MELGGMIVLTDDFENEFMKTSELGIPTYHLLCWNEPLYTDEMVQRKSLSASYTMCELVMSGADGVDRHSGI